MGICLKTDKKWHTVMARITHREGDGKGREAKELSFHSLLLLLTVWPLQRDAFMCYFYSYRNIRNKKLKKITAKIN